MMHFEDLTSAIDEATEMASQDPSEEEVTVQVSHRRYGTTDRGATLVEHAINGVLYDAQEDPQDPIFVRATGADYFELQSFRIQPGTTRDQALDELRGIVSHHPTFAWVNSGKLHMLWLYDGHTLREWADLGPISFDSAQKLMKRLSIFGWAERMTAQFTDLSVKIYPSNDLFDGISYVSPSFVYSLIEHDEVARDNLLDDEGNFKHRRFHIRVLTPYGLVKGDALVVDNLEADIVTTEDNIPREIYTTDGSYHAAAFVQKQAKPAYTNIQSVLYGLDLFFDSYRLVSTLRVDMINALNEIADANLPEWAKLGEISRASEREISSATYFADRIARYEEAGLPASVSPRNVMNVAENRFRSFVPASQRVTERRFRLPYAGDFYLLSESAARYAGHTFTLRKGKVVLTDIGLIVHDDDYARVADILGGADQDDRVTCMLVLDQHGEYRLAMLRDPIGTQSDGQTVGLEYVVLKPTLESAQRLLRKEKNYRERLGAPDLPLYVIDTDSLPAVSVDVRNNLPDPDATLSGGEMHEHTIYKVVEKATVGARLQVAYGTHALLNMAAWNAGVPLPAAVPETEFIDAASQYMTSSDADYIEAKNQQDAALLADASVDTPIAVRIESTVDSVFKLHGPIAQFMDRYNALVGDFYHEIAEIVRFSVDRLVSQLNVSRPDWDDLNRKYRANQARFRGQFANAADYWDAVSTGIVNDIKSQFANRPASEKVAYVTSQISSMLVSTQLTKNYTDENGEFISPTSLFYPADTPLSNGDGITMLIWFYGTQIDLDALEPMVEFTYGDL